MKLLFSLLFLLTLVACEDEVKIPDPVYGPCVEMTEETYRPGQCKIGDWWNEGSERCHSSEAKCLRSKP